MDGVGKAVKKVLSVGAARERVQVGNERSGTGGIFEWNGGERLGIF